MTTAFRSFQYSVANISPKVHTMNGIQTIMKRQLKEEIRNVLVSNAKVEVYIVHIMCRRYCNIIIIEGLD